MRLALMLAFAAFLSTERAEARPHKSRTAEAKKAPKQKVRPKKVEDDAPVVVDEAPPKKVSGGPVAQVTDDETPPTKKPR